MADNEEEDTYAVRFSKHYTNPVHSNIFKSRSKTLIRKKHEITNSFNCDETFSGNL